MRDALSMLLITASRLILIPLTGLTLALVTTSAKPVMVETATTPDLASSAAAVPHRS